MDLDLQYGKGRITFEARGPALTVIGDDSDEPGLSDAELGAALDRPSGSAVLEEIVSPGERVVLVVPDATRDAGSGQVLNLIVRRLIANGTMPYDITVLIACGIHRRSTDSEKESILTPFIAQRTKAVDHDARELTGFVRLGTTSSGIPVELNRLLVESDRVITVGGVTFHYFAGFTGGRKSVCPGLASARTIAATHRLAFDFEDGKRAPGVEVGKLEGNPVHEAFVEAASFRPPDFAVNTIVNAAGQVSEVFCGDWIRSHLEAVRSYSETHSRRIDGKKDLVIVSAGGFPYDLNLIQAHKALEMASSACKDGGTIVFVAECADGTGRRDFLDWFQGNGSEGIARRLGERYKVNGQTAWALAEKAERFDIRMITSLPEEVVSGMGIRKVSAEKVSSAVRGFDSGYVMPFGAKFLPQVGGKER